MTRYAAINALDALQNEGGGGGGDILPPVTLTGTDPSTSPLTIEGADGQTADLLAVWAHGRVAGTEFNPDGSVLINAPVTSFPVFSISGRPDSTGDLFAVTLGAGALIAIDATGVLSFAAANTQTTVGAAGVGAALPALPNGYMKAKAAGTPVLIPYYAAA